MVVGHERDRKVTGRRTVSRTREDEGDLTRRVVLPNLFCTQSKFSGEVFLCHSRIGDLGYLPWHKPLSQKCLRLFNSSQDDLISSGIRLYILTTGIFFSPSVCVCRRVFLFRYTPTSTSGPTTKMSVLCLS